MNDDNLDRFVSNVSAVKLGESLGIDVDIERVQRREIERANGERTEQFLDYYDRCRWLDDDDKFALMANHCILRLGPRPIRAITLCLRGYEPG